MSSSPSARSGEHTVVSLSTRIARRWSELVHILGQWLRTTPCSVFLSLLMLIAACASHLTRARWMHDLAAQGGHVQPLHTFTTVLWAPSTGIMINLILMMLIVGGLLERFLGSKVWALSAVVSLPLSLAGLWACAALAHSASLNWAFPMVSGPVSGSILILTSALGTASAKMNRLWAWRTRIGVLVILLALFAFSSSAGSLARLFAFVSGCLVGGFAIGWSTRNRSMLGIGDPVRHVIPLVITAYTLGAVNAIWTFTSHGLLAFDRAAFSPELAEQQYMWALCQQNEAPMRCLKEVYGNSLMLYAPVVLASIPFLVQLVLAFGLFRGRRGAWVGTIILQGALSVIGVAQTILFLASISGSAEEVPEGYFAVNIPTMKLLVGVAFPLTAMLLTAWNASAFQVRAPKSRWKRAGIISLVSFLAGGIVALAVGMSMPYYFVPDATPLNLLEAYLTAYAPAGAQWLFDTPLYATTVAAATATVWSPVAVWVISSVSLLKVFLAPVDVSHEKQDELLSLVTSQGAGSLGWMLTWQGNSTWISPDRTCGVSYRQESGVALTLTQCSADEEHISSAISEFATFATDASLIPALYSVHEEWAKEAHRLGWSTVKVAEEAIIDLGDLEFKGKKFQDVRTAFNHATREGIRAQWASYPNLDEASKEQIQAICQAWADEKALPEMGFTLGGLRELDDPQTRLLLAVDEEDHIHAVTSWMPVHSKGSVIGLTLDVMRRDDQGFRLAIDFLIGQAALLAQEEGLQFISLSGAPLAESGQCEEPEDLRDSHFAFAPVLDVMGNAMEPVYGFRSLLAYKKKFQVRFVPLYLAIPDIAQAPAVGLAIAHAYLPGMSAASAVSLAAKLVSRD